MNFIIKLFESQNQISIIIIVCYLCKKAHFVLCKNLEILIIAQSFIKYVWKHHELSDSVISDQESQFVSAF